MQIGLWLCGPCALKGAERGKNGAVTVMGEGHPGPFFLILNLFGVGGVLVTRLISSPSLDFDSFVPS